MIAPGRNLVVMDPRKLGYFARAAAVRAGAQGTYGALGDVDIAGQYGYDNLLQKPAAVSNQPGAYTGPGAAGGWVSDTAVPYNTNTGGWPTGASGSNTTDQNGTSSIDMWMKRLSSVLTPSKALAPGASVQAPSILPFVLGGVGLLVGGLILMKVLKKK